MRLLRSALFNLFFFASGLVLLIPGGILALVAPGRVLGYEMAWARLEIAALRVICGIDYVVTGRENLPPDGPALIASRHQSAFDTFIWMLIVPRCCYVLKRELLSIPLFGAMLRASAMIVVARDAGPAAIRTLVRDGAAAAAAGRQIIIFPEGTRAEPGSAVTLQPGIAALASRTGLPVIPVATNSGRHWGRRTFRKTPGTIRIVIGPPIPAGSRRRDLMERLETALRDDAIKAFDPVHNSVG